MEEAWAQLDGETVEKEVSKAFKTMAKAAKTFAARDLPACAENSVTLRDEVAAFREFVPLVQALRNPGMRKRHWAQLSERLGVDLRPDRADTLARAQVRVPPALIDLASQRRLCPTHTCHTHGCAVQEMGLLEEGKLAEISKVADVAGKEFGIEQALDKMEAEWAGLALAVVPYRETGTHVIKVPPSCLLPGAAGVLLCLHCALVAKFPPGQPEHLQRPVWTLRAATACRWTRRWRSCWTTTSS